MVNQCLDGFAPWFNCYRTDREPMDQKNLRAQSTGCAALMNYMFLAQQNGRPIRFKKVAFFAPLVKPTHYRVVHLGYILLSPFLKQVKRSFK